MGHISIWRFVRNAEIIFSNAYRLLEYGSFRKRLFFSTNNKFTAIRRGDCDFVSSKLIETACKINNDHIHLPKFIIEIFQDIYLEFECCLIAKSYRQSNIIWSLGFISNFSILWKLNLYIEKNFMIWFI